MNINLILKFFSYIEKNIELNLIKYYLIKFIEFIEQLHLPPNDKF